MKRKALSQKEIDFCRYYARLRSPREAAVLAGYPAVTARRRGLALLEDPLIQKQVARFSSSGDPDALRALAAAGLERAAFGDAADAVRLTTMDDETIQREAGKMELFSIAELKRPRGGGLEIKFLDRIKALEALGRLCGPANAAGPDDAGFYTALAESARALARRRDADGPPDMPEDGQAAEDGREAP